jgi:hypothetical protein
MKWNEQINFRESTGRKSFPMVAQGEDVPLPALVQIPF